jgi:hypothetical protein
MFLVLFACLRVTKTTGPKSVNTCKYNATSTQIKPWMTGQDCQSQEQQRCNEQGGWDSWKVYPNFAANNIHSPTQGLTIKLKTYDQAHFKIVPRVSMLCTEEWKCAQTKWKFLKTMRCTAWNLTLPQKIWYSRQKNATLHNGSGLSLRSSWASVQITHVSWQSRRPHL